MVFAGGLSPISGLGVPTLDAIGVAHLRSAEPATPVMGSPDRRPSVARNLVDIDRLLGSSVSDAVRIQADCPVLFVRKAE